MSRLKEGNPSAAMPRRSNPLREPSQGRVSVKYNLKEEEQISSEPYNSHSEFLSLTGC